MLLRVKMEETGFPIFRVVTFVSKNTDATRTENLSKDAPSSSNLGEFRELILLAAFSLLITQTVNLNSSVLRMSKAYAWRS